MKYSIFKANRGEGKTSWLIKKVLKLPRKKYRAFYAGRQEDFTVFCEKYFKFVGKRCDVEFLNETTELPKDEFILITDGLIRSIPFIPDSLKMLLSVNDSTAPSNVEWFMTMDGEDFESW